LYPIVRKGIVIVVIIIIIIIIIIIKRKKRINNNVYIYIRPPWDYKIPVKITNYKIPALDNKQHVQ